MVSRGGRSKGCTNCRRRRVKCDETRPVCNRCKNRGLECDGPKEHTFIHHSTRPKAVPLCAELQVVTKPCSQLTFSAFQDDICLAYTRKVVLKGGPAELACNMALFDRPGVDEDPGLKLLRDSIMSLATAFFGNQHQQWAIQAKGCLQYGNVLGRLNNHLGTPELQTTDLTILCALICMLFETFLPTGPLSFLKHVRGLETILEMRGVPEAPTPRSTLVLLHGLRTLSIVSGLVMARTCLFSRPEWKQLHCVAIGEEAQLKCNILDVLADCTQYMDEGTKLLFPTPCSLEARQPLISEVKKALLLLELIHERWVIYNREEMAKAPSSTAARTKIANLYTATIFMHYNAAYIILMDILKTLDPEPMPNWVPLRNAAALNIIDCLHVKSSDQREGAAPSSAIGLVATKVGWQALGGFNNPEGRKMSRILQDSIGGVFDVSAFEGPTVEEGSPCHLLHKLKESEANKAAEDDRWPLLNEFGPTTVVGDAIATAIMPMLRRV